MNRIKDHDPGKRTFLRLTGTGVAGIALGGVIAPISRPDAPTPACNTKDLSSWVVAIVNGFGEIKTFLPDLGLSKSAIDKIASLLAKGSAIASKFDEAYKRGDFSNATLIFKSLGDLIIEVRTELGIAADNRFVSIALAAIGIARVAIALLLDKQGQANPQVMAKVSGVAAGSPESAAVSEVQRLAATDLTKLSAAIPH